MKCDLRLRVGNITGWFYRGLTLINDWKIMEYAYTSKFNERFKKENGDRGALYRKLQKLCRKYVSRNYYQNCARTTFPFLGTLRSYKVKDYLANDVISGLTVGVMQIPQGKISLLFFWVIDYWGNSKCTLGLNEYGAPFMQLKIKWTLWRKLLI